MRFATVAALGALSVAKAGMFDGYDIFPEPTRLVDASCYGDGLYMGKSEAEIERCMKEAASFAGWCANHQDADLCKQHAARGLSLKKRQEEGVEDPFAGLEFDFSDMFADLLPKELVDERCYDLRIAEVGEE